MSYAEKTYFTWMSVTFVVTLIAFVLLISPSFKKAVSLRLAIAALVAVPPIQLIVFAALDQIRAVGLQGFVTGSFMCAGVHGSGSRSGCTLYEVLFESVISSVVFSFISFGLVPLAVFTCLLLIFSVLKKTFQQKER